MTCEPAGLRPTYLNANGQRGRACDKQQSAWCAVERPFGDEVFGIAVFDSPGNANHPPNWHLDEQGLLTPSLTGLNGWSLDAGKERVYRYRIVVYKGPGRADTLGRQFETFATSPTAATPSGASKK